MEVPVIGRITTTTLQNQSSSIPVMANISKDCSFWNWGLLYLAFLATLVSILVTRVGFMILRYRQDRSSASSYTISCVDFDDDFSDLDDIDDDEDEEEEEDDDDDMSDSSIEDEEGEVETETVERDEDVKSKLQREFSWSDFAKGKSVVKLWDGIGLGLDLNQFSGSFISIYDLDREQRLTSVFDKYKFSPVILPAPSPSIIAEWNLVGRGGRRAFSPVAADTWWETE